ncbi:MAG: superoxide dismutase family protein [Deltaproteobacteria bacterium]|nr:superoxide dismutase family protein [Deltaproteobacteria bacterium]
MTRTISTLLGFLLISCGGGDKKEPQAPVAPPPDPVVTAEPEPPPPPPPPKTFSAKAALTPVKGAKIAAVTVNFAQTEGESTKVTAEIEGLKAGRYHFVIHESAECGPNATKAGAVFAPGSSAPLVITVLKGAIGELDESVTLPLDGDAAIVGHTLVLHEDKKGAPGKAVACGTIDAAGDAAAPPPAE